MEAFDIIGILLTLSAVFGFFNYKYIKLPTTIGLMLLGLIFSLIIIITGTFNNDFYVFAQNFVNDVRLDESLLGIMLSYLLFAGALHVKLEDLSSQKWVIAILATIGVILSTFIIGTLSYFLMMALGIKINFIYCLLFGANLTN